MTCVVFGASGFIGHYLLPRLAQQDGDVVAVSRQVHDAAAAVCWRRGTLPDAVPRFADAVTAVVCLGPLDHFTTWLEQVQLRGRPRVVAMSSMSAESKRESPDSAERALAARLNDAEQRLLARCAELQSACTILRATLIYGGPAGSLERAAARARRWHLFPLPRGQGLRQPVHAADLALAVLAALEQPQATGIIEVGGGERMTASALFVRARRHWAPRTLGVPLAAPLCTALAALRGRGRGMAARLRMDLVADNTRLQSELGVRPRGFPGRPDGGAV